MSRIKKVSSWKLQHNSLWKLEGPWISCTITPVTDLFSDPPCLLFNAKVRSTNGLYEEDLIAATTFDLAADWCRRKVEAQHELEGQAIKDLNWSL